MLTSPLLETKLHVPRNRPRMVDRPRLTDRLERTLESRLTLVSAPAGFGKSTLIASWLANATGDRKVAWFSIEPGDTDPVTFWTYLISALRTTSTDLGEGSLPLLDPKQPNTAAAVDRLINELGKLSTDVVLVLDDYHGIASADVHVAMTHLLDHLPPSTHLVIATRADPPFALSRLRARGELVEIRAADLRFTPEEAAAYFDAAGLSLDADDMAALESRTEGWIAALQLALLSMEGRDNVSEFIAGFTGDDRYIVDYLVEEVLQRQTDAVRGFLLQTSILARLSGSLCAAVTEADDGVATLDALDRANLFLIPLDDRRAWYRYHHLFADVLHARLLAERPDEVPELHRRASEWLEQHGDLSGAIEHSIAGEDFERAAQLVELAAPETQRHRQDALRRRWMDALPDAVIRRSPTLSNLFAGTLLVQGHIEGVTEYLDAAEQALEQSPAATDERTFHDLPGAIAIHRAGLARLLDDVPGTIAHASRALELTRDDNDLGRAAASALLGLAHWSNGDLEAADRGYVAAISHLEHAGHISDVLGCSIALADIRTARGSLGGALLIHQRGLELAAGSGPVTMRGVADMHVGIADVLRERNDLEGALVHLDAAAQLGEESGLPQNPYRSRLVQARVRHATGDTDAALELCAEAERLYNTDFSPRVRPPSAFGARMLITLGRVSEARRWADEQGLSPDDELTYVREFEHATLVRLLIAQDRTAEALTLVDRLLLEAEQGVRTQSVIDLLVARAIALKESGDPGAAIVATERAAELAEPEGHVRVFLDEGPLMASLLESAAQGRTSGYLAALRANVTSSTRSPNQRLVEPLSERELDVLRLLVGDLDGPGIANELIVSLNTVRTHTKNIYAKLGVNSRRAAVRRASEIGLLSTDRTGRPR